MPNARPMPVNVRWIISIGVLPLAMGATFLFDHLSTDWTLIDFPLTALGEKVTFLFPAVALFVAQFFIWSPAIRWTLYKRLVYLIVSAIYIGCMVLAAFPYNIMFGRWTFEKIAVWPLTVGFAAVLNAWAYGTSPTRSDAETRVACPKCGYDLRAQRECRCPECGHAFTLADIAGGPPRRPPPGAA